MAQPHATSFTLRRLLRHDTVYVAHTLMLETPDSYETSVPKYTASHHQAISTFYLYVMHKQCISVEAKSYISWSSSIHVVRPGVPPFDVLSRNPPTSTQPVCLTSVTHPLKFQSVTKNTSLLSRHKSIGQQTLLRVSALYQGHHQAKKLQRKTLYHAIWYKNRNK